MAKYRQEVEMEDGWTGNIIPVMNDYRMACCDCGLVHGIKFTAIKVTKTFPDGSFKYIELPKDKYRVSFKANRNNRATAARRRKKK